MNCKNQRESLPSCEFVLLVPGRFSVSNKYQSVLIAHRGTALHTTQGGPGKSWCRLTQEHDELKCLGYVFDHGPELLIMSITYVLLQVAVNPIWNPLLEDFSTAWFWCNCENKKCHVGSVLRSAAFKICIRKKFRFHTSIPDPEHKAFFFKNRTPSLVSATYKKMLASTQSSKCFIMRQE